MSEVYISNKMTSTYSLVAVRESYVEVEITIGRYNNNDVAVEIIPRVISKSDKQVQLEVKYASRSEVEVEITPTINNDVEVEIEVNPHNRMTATYNLMEPAVITETLSPVQDSYVIQSAPYNVINYGKNNSMLVGNDDKGQNLGLIQFDLSSISHEVRIKSARLRIYYSQLSAENIELYNVKDTWSELGITYQNKPSYSGLIVDSYKHNTVDRYLEFDIKNTATGWIRGLVNNGLVITSNDIGIDTFRARESTYPPQLIVEYYSPLPYSFENSKREVEITCQHLMEFSVPVEIEVHTTFVNHDVEVEIYVHNPADVLESGHEVEITVSRPDTETEITVMVKGTSNIEVEISCGMESISYVDAEIEVASYDGVSDVEVEIETKALPTKAYYSVEVEIEATREYISSDSSVEVEIEIVDGSTSSMSDIEVEIEISEKPVLPSSFVPVEIEVAEYLGTNNVEVEISIVGFHHSSVEVEIETTREYISSVSDIEVEIEATREYISSDSSVEVEIEISKKPVLASSFIPVEIEVAEYLGTSNIEVEIGIVGFHHSAVEVEIEAVRVTIDGLSDVEVEISVPTYSYNDVEVEFFVSKPSAEVEIVVPYYGADSVEVEIQARVLMVDDIQVEIEVNNPNSSYAYIYII